MLIALGALVVPVSASADTGDVGVQDMSHSGTGTPTGTKRATSVLWFNDGSWWGNLWDSASSDFHIFRFNATTSSWVDTGVATESRADTHHDVLWDGKTLYVASYKFVNDELPAEPNFPTIMRRYSYDSAAKKYTLLGSSQINNSKVEVLTIDKDSTGRVWSSWQEGNKIYLNATATDGKTWGTPFQVPGSMSNVSVDDTSAVIAFDGKIGVMWSRQVGDSTDGMYWSYHVDGASNTAWSSPVAAVSGQRSSDDHMNLKWLDSSGGRVFAAIKTSYISASQPLIQLLALSGTTWSAHTIATVAECPNRVIVMIDESTQRLRTFATYPKPAGTTNAGVCSTSGGAIYEKSTPLDKISFTTTKTARIVDADQYVHNVTSTKQNINSAASGTADSGLLLLADVNATSRYWHYYDPRGGGSVTAPPAGQSPIAAKAASLNGALGAATTGEVYGLKDNGGYQCFERGCILWSPATGAHISVGAIRGLWAATGFENGRLGYPTTDEVGGLKDGGVYQNYQGGAIIWSPATGAHISVGAIRTIWASTGFESGRLGYPTSDEYATGNDGSVAQNYQGGVIHWSPSGYYIS
jgi:LGFP repeat